MRKETFEPIIAQTEVDSEKAEKNKFVLIFKKLLHSHADEIPDRVVSNEGNAKVRKAWWFELTMYLELANMEGIVSDDTLKDEILDFVEDYTRVEYDEDKKQSNHEFNKRLTTREDIERANSLIKKVLEHIDK